MPIFGREIGNTLEYADTGVVDQVVQASKRPIDRFAEPLYIFQLRNIGHFTVNAAGRLLLHFLQEALHSVARASAYGNRSAGPQQGKGNGAPDTTGASRHNRNFPGQSFL